MADHRRLREGGWGDARKRERHVGLLAIALLLPAPAWAEVCDTARPGWAPGQETTLLGEALALYSSVPALGLLVFSVIVTLKRSQWGALVAVVLWSGFVSLIALADPGGIKELARQEGCMASPALFILSVAAICSAMILYTLPRETRL